MARPKKPFDRAKLNLVLPQATLDRLNIVLWNEFEQRVPVGAYQTFFLARLAEYFEWESLDLAPWMGEVAVPGVYVVKAPGYVVKVLRAILDKKDLSPPTK